MSRPPGAAPAADPLAAQAAGLQAALAGEHAAVWAHGRAAGELSGRARTRALDGLDDHRRARDRLRAQLVALGAAPVEAAAAYVEPEPVDSPAGARALLAHVERALVPTYADLAAASPPAGRQPAAQSAARAGVRALGWGAVPEAFPGT
ncbi:MAG: ferritin-like domain-containing protein [Candidatus Nanopelagicales bacterium]|jgi:hypothetical protein|nr:ferritin-like domain-containing protein [Candidatus Nanopelagicales bacterium]MCU0937447.1 ferritin-like domain-containing protein [Gammaproteobacteria bacterium]